MIDILGRTGGAMAGAGITAVEGVGLASVYDQFVSTAAGAQRAAGAHDVILRKMAAGGAEMEALMGGAEGAEGYMNIVRNLASIEDQAARTAAITR